MNYLVDSNRVIYASVYGDVGVPDGQLLVTVNDEEDISLIDNNLGNISYNNGTLSVINLPKEKSAEENFNYRKLQDGLLRALRSGRFSSKNVRLEFPQISSFIMEKLDFADMKDMIIWYVSEGILTVGDSRVIRDVILEQGIDIDSYKMADKQ